MQLLLGHSKLESTVRYLGIEVDDALELSEQVEVTRVVATVGAETVLHSCTTRLRHATYWTHSSPSNYDMHSDTKPAGWLSPT